MVRCPLHSEADPYRPVVEYAVVPKEEVATNGEWMQCEICGVWVYVED